MDGSDESRVIRQLLGRSVPGRKSISAGPGILPSRYQLDRLAGFLQGDKATLFSASWSGDLHEVEWNPKRRLDLELVQNIQGRAELVVQTLVYTAYGSPVEAWNYRGPDLRQALEITRKQFDSLEVVGAGTRDHGDRPPDIREEALQSLRRLEAVPG